jgi:hypothetical protein
MAGRACAAIIRYIVSAEFMVSQDSERRLFANGSRLSRGVCMKCDATNGFLKMSVAVMIWRGL